jgi:hypothetical protein
VMFVKTQHFGRQSKHRHSVDKLMPKKAPTVSYGGQHTRQNSKKVT